VVTTGAIRRAKRQSKCHHKQTNIRFFTGQAGCPSCRPTNHFDVSKRVYNIGDRGGVCFTKIAAA